MTVPQAGRGKSWVQDNLGVVWVTGTRETNTFPRTNLEKKKKEKGNEKNLNGMFPGKKGAVLDRADATHDLLDSKRFKKKKKAMRRRTTKEEKAPCRPDRERNFMSRGNALQRKKMLACCCWGTKHRKKACLGRIRRGHGEAGTEKVDE